MTGPEISPVPREARAYQGATAGLVTRLVANTIDAAVVAVMVGGGYLGWASVIFLLDPRAFEFPSASFFAFLTAGLFLATVYLWLAWWLVGRSYGGHVMGIRVTGRHRPRLGPLRALGRAAFCVFFPIGLFWCLVSPKRRSVQDIAVFSSVVYDWMPRPAGQGAALPGAGGSAQETATGAALNGVAVPDAEPVTRHRFSRRDAQAPSDPSSTGG